MVASALAVAVSFSAMAVSGLLTFRILGPSLAVAVLAMLATSVTVVPAVLALGSRRRARSARWTRPPQHATIGRVAGLVGRRPAPVALGAVAVLAALAVAALGYHPSYDQQPYPAGSQSAAGGCRNCSAATPQARWTPRSRRRRTACPASYRAACQLRR